MIYISLIKKNKVFFFLLGTLADAPAGVLQAVHRQHVAACRERWSMSISREIHKWHTSDTQVTHKWHTRDTQVTHKWHTSDTQVTHKWHTSDTQVTHKWHTSDTQGIQPVMAIMNMRRGAILPVCVNFHLLQKPLDIRAEGELLRCST